VSSDGPGASSNRFFCATCSTSASTMTSQIGLIGLAVMGQVGLPPKWYELRAGPAAVRS